MLIAVLAIAFLSVGPSITRRYCAKTNEVRIMPSLLAGIVYVSSFGDVDNVQCITKFSVCCHQVHAAMLQGDLCLLREAK